MQAKGTRTPTPLLGKRPNEEQPTHDQRTRASPTKRLRGDHSDASSPVALNQESDESFLAAPKLDFNHFISYLLPGTKPKPIKAEFGKIGSIRNLKLVEKNKMSQKLGRRDIQFYDLHKLNQPPEDVKDFHERNYETKESQYDADQYADIEVDNFNKVYENDDVIRKHYGDSIRVKLAVDAGMVSRQVVEDLSKADIP